MKPKQFALVALVGWLGVASWVGSMILAKPQAFPTGYAEADGAVAAQIELEIQQADALGVSLTSLQQTPRDIATAAIIAVPPKSGSETTDADRSAAASDGFAVAASEAGPAPRIVSFIISGAGMAPQAMIDGVLVGKGARLHDGAVVRRIDPRAVQIRDSEGKTHTLAVRVPGEAAPSKEGTP